MLRASLKIISVLRACQCMVVIAFRCRKSIITRVRWGLALSSINAGLVTIAWLSKRGTTTVSRMSLWHVGPLRLPWTVTRSNLQPCETHPPHHHRTTAKWSGFLDVVGGIGGISFSPHMSSSIRHVQKKTVFIRPMNLSPQSKIPSVAYLTPYQTSYVICWCQKETFDRPTSVVPRILLLIPYGPRWNGTVGNSIISQDRVAGKRGNVEQVITPCSLVRDYPGRFLPLTSLVDIFLQVDWLQYDFYSDKATFPCMTIAHYVFQQSAT